MGFLKRRAKRRARISWIKRIVTLKEHNVGGYLNKKNEEMESSPSRYGSDRRIQDSILTYAYHAFRSLPADRSIKQTYLLHIPIITGNSNPFEIFISPGSNSAIPAGGV